jgi:methylase of polypeptide subunit release factors
MDIAENDLARTVDEWVAVGSDLVTGPGVHRPSPFSAVLASTMASTEGQVVVDAGCGAGLVAVAALSAGAHHVIAQDYDPAALADTAANVERVLGASGRRRLTLWEAHWRHLAPMRADLLAVNPPQRPSRLLDEVDPEVLHLHDGGGHDGFDALRLVLAHARTTAVRTTAAAVLDLPGTSFEDVAPGWCAPRPVGKAVVPFDRSWRQIQKGHGRVDVWEFTRTPDRENSQS